MIWAGRPEYATFLIQVPDDFPDELIIGTVEVRLDRVPVGQITFQISIGESSEPEPIGNGKRFESVFMSYLHKDIERVVDCAKTLKSVGVENVYMDKTLDPGVPWASQLAGLIRNSEAFMQFGLINHTHVCRKGDSSGCWPHRDAFGSH